MLRRFVGLFIFVCAASISSFALSQSALSVTYQSKGIDLHLTLADLQAMPQVEIKTANEFVDGVRTFRGPLVRDVLARADALGAKHAVFTAANDYQVDVSNSEFFTYDAILALTMDGVALSARDKGPIWMIYPMSDFEVLRDPVYNSRLIWQVVAMDLF